MNGKIEKILVSILLIVIFSSGLILPKRAEAIAVIDIVHIGKTVYQTMREEIMWLEEKTGLSLRDIIAKRIIDHIVDQTTEWIQGGGKPRFVTDWNGFMKDAGQAAIGDVILQTDAAFLCSPFKLQVKLSLLPVKKFGQRVECTLDDIVENIEDFYENFENGGWLAYNEAWQPQNNYFGTMLIIHDEMLSKEWAASEAARNEALAGKGFLSVKRCLEYEPNKQLDALIQSCTNTGATGAALSNCIDSAKKSAPPSKCLKEEIITPGDTVGAAVADAVTSDTKWAANIHSWTSALVNAVINRVIKEGVGLVKGGSSAGGGGSSYRPPEYQTVVDAEIASQKRQMTKQVQAIINEWQYILNAKRNSLSSAEQLLVIYQGINARNCIPLVSSSEIQAVQDAINILKPVIIALENKIKEANNVIATINLAGTVRQLTIAQQGYAQFMDKYDTQVIQEQILSGANRLAADQEAQAWQINLTNGQNRLNTCIQLQSQN
ncbi:MAG: hypothetical protein AAB596_00140 [Patescibacteria group bacterium]